MAPTRNRKVKCSFQFFHKGLDNQNVSDLRVEVSRLRQDYIKQDWSPEQKFNTLDWVNETQAKVNAYFEAIKEACLPE